MNLCLVYNNLGPYHYARLGAFSKLVPQLLVIEIADSSAIHDWRLQETVKAFKQETLFPGRKAETLSSKSVTEATQEVLERYKPDVVVTAGYRDPAAQAAAKWAKKNRLKTILMLDSWEGDKHRLWLKEKAKAWIVQRWFDSAFVGGWRHYLYALSLGFHSQHIWRGVDVVDNEYFHGNSKKIRSQNAVFRKQHKLPARYFLCVARHSSEKNLKGLLKAYKLYTERNGEWSLVLVGDGPQRQELEKEARRYQLDSVFFTGWVQYENLPVYYSLANAFILPSTSETWGLALNEAMASGLPILISRKCGSLPELCWRGVNGYDFDPYNIEEIAEALSLISSDIDRCKAMGEASQEIISNFSPRRWASTLSQCIDQGAQD